MDVPDEFTSDFLLFLNNKVLYHVSSIFFLILIIIVYLTEAFSLSFVVFVLCMWTLVAVKILVLIYIRSVCRSETVLYNLRRNGLPNLLSTSYKEAFNLLKPNLHFKLT